MVLREMGMPARRIAFDRRGRSGLSRRTWFYRRAWPGTQVRTCSLPARVRVQARVHSASCTGRSADLDDVHAIVRVRPGTHSYSTDVSPAPIGLTSSAHAVRGQRRSCSSIGRGTIVVGYGLSSASAFSLRLRGLTLPRRAWQCPPRASWPPCSGVRHPLRLGADDLLGGQRELVFDLRSDGAARASTWASLWGRAVPRGRRRSVRHRQSCFLVANGHVLIAPRAAVDRLRRKRHDRFDPGFPAAPCGAIAYRSGRRERRRWRPRRRSTHVLHASMPSSNMASVVASSSTSALLLPVTFGIRNRPWDSRL